MLHKFTCFFFQSVENCISSWGVTYEKGDEMVDTESILLGVIVPFSVLFRCCKWKIFDRALLVEL